jgi:hypothetical protein
MNAPAPPKYRYGVVWGVLTLLLLFGSVACAFFAYGLSGLIANGPVVVDLLIMAVATCVVVYLILLIVGILYRIDRLRGTAHRRIELFE